MWSRSIASALLAACLGVPQAVAAEADVYERLNLLGDVFERVRSEYVDKPDDARLVEAAIRGILRSLDSGSDYLSPQELAALESGGGQAAPGLDIALGPDGPVIVSAIDGTQAAEAGLLGGDRITHVDGAPTTGLSLDSVAALMRGPAGSSVALTMLRPGRGAPFAVDLVREGAAPRPVRHDVEEGIGHLRIAAFDAGTGAGVLAALDEMTRDGGLKGVVIDLRNCSGGGTGETVEVADAFLDGGVIVSVRGRNPADGSQSMATQGDAANGLPLAVLVNGGSNGAAEIVAAALRGNGRATVVGTRSFGGAAVREIIRLGESGALRLTTGRYHDPAGEPISGRGVEPDLSVRPELPQELAVEGSVAAMSFVPRERAEDLQLRAAIDAVLERAGDAQAPPRDAGSGEKDDEVDIAFWRSVADTADPAELEAYLEAFPNGLFAALAKVRLKRLREQ